MDPGGDPSPPAREREGQAGFEPGPVEDSPGEPPEGQGLPGEPPEGHGPPGEPPLSQGPPGGGTFSLEGRRAPGLYLAGWILSIGGLLLTFLIGPMASNVSLRLLLIGAGLAVVTLGLSAAAGSMVLERVDRHPQRYRGPAPLLVFGIYVFAVSLLGLVLAGVLGVDPTDPSAFLLVALLQGAGYVLVVWLFAVRTGALSLSQMGWPAWPGPGRSVLRAVVTGAAVMVPATFGLLFLGGLLGLLLGVEPPDILPTRETTLDVFLVALAAAIVIPAGEELFFRGFALSAWRRDLGERSALIRSSLFFALVHVLNIGSEEGLEGLDVVLQGLAVTALQTAVLLPAGLLLGWLFLRHGLGAAIAAHATYNGILLLLATIATSLPQPV